MTDEKPPPGDQTYRPSSASTGGRDERIGPYRLLQRVGEGGMGEVWQAEQSAPVWRIVALKIIKQGMDTRHVVARFEAERQALALMDHPAVAKVFDAGATPRGRPYFVMEYVQGVPVTEHCDRHRLPNRERLHLFLQICQGVQHAHQKGVIHRDLKPSNVLVTLQDGRPVAKIIDFGVAKATGQKLTERTLYTELGVLIGTPEYMSPEQAELTGQDIDTRTDVYSLGVMLYELLVGALPFDSNELRNAGFEGIRRKIREEEPPRPSQRVSSLGDGPSRESAQNRRVDPPTLRGQLRGELDWIVMRALEKERARRYGSPAELAAEVERYLRDEPVLAGPPSASYRARKFVRRHRVGVSLAATAVLALVGFGIGMSALYARALRAERAATDEAETARRALDFMTEMFDVSDPGRARGDTITAREVLDGGAERVASELEGQPEVQTRLMTTMGRVYRNLGLYEESRRLLEQALERRRRVLGEEHPDTLESMHELALLHENQGRRERAESLAVETLKLRRRVLGDDHVDTLRSIDTLAYLYHQRGRFAEAEALIREALEARRSAEGDHQPDTLRSMEALAYLYLDYGRTDEAEPLVHEAYEGFLRLLGEEHPSTLSALDKLAWLHESKGRFEQAERLARKLLEARIRILGDDHPSTQWAKHRLGRACMRLGRLAEAETLYLETLSARRRILGDDHQDTIWSIYGLALIYDLQGRAVEAEASHRQVLEARRRLLGAGHEETLESMDQLAQLLARQRRFAEAERLYRDAIEACHRSLGEAHPYAEWLEDSLERLLASRDG